MSQLPTSPTGHLLHEAIADLHIDRAARVVTLKGQPVKLGDRAFDLLACLAAKPGRVFSNDELLQLVWPGRVVDETNLRAQIHKLRQQVGSQRIANINGRGYAYSATPAANPAVPLGPVLPRPSGPLLGRDHDLAALGQLVAAHQLVTLQGPGGIGKTQLALALSIDRRARQPEPVWWVDLTVPGTAKRLALSIAQALGLQTGSLQAQASGRQLGAALAGHEGLLVLDNAEYAASPLAELLQDLLPLATALRVLVTSQQRLEVPGEQVYRLGPLEPEPALQLLLRSARTVDHRYKLDSLQLEPAARLCERLDRLPLAIEMAGAQLPTLGLQALLHHLHDRLRLLGSEQAAGPERQRTLQQTLEWSHAALPAQAQVVLRRLSVFARPFRLDSAQRVAADDTLDAVAVARALTVLTDRSLLQLQPGTTADAAPRWRLLETPRLFAAQQLDSHQERSATQRRHAQAMAALAEAARAEYWTRGDEAWLASWRDDHEDLVLGFDHACDAGDAESAALIGEALSAAANLTGLYQQILQRTEPALALLPLAGPLARAQLWNRSTLGVAVGGLTRLQACERRVQAWRMVDEPMGLARALANLLVEHERAGNKDEADALLVELKTLEQPHWPPRQRALGVAMAEMYLGSLRQDVELLQRSMLAWQAQALQGGLTRLAQQALGNLASVDILQGHPERAVAKLQQVATANRASGNLADAALILNRLAKVLLIMGDRSAARDWLEQALLTSADQNLMARFAESGATLALAVDQPAWAARLLGAAMVFEQLHPAAASVWERQALATLQQRLAACLDAATLAACRAAGARLAAPEVHRLLLDWLRDDLLVS